MIIRNCERVCPGTYWTYWNASQVSHVYDAGRRQQCKRQEWRLQRETYVFRKTIPLCLQSTCIDKSPLVCRHLPVSAYAYIEHSDDTGNHRSEHRNVSVEDHISEAFARGSQYR
jgi:hypothetical protein